MKNQTKAAMTMMSNLYLMLKLSLIGILCGFMPSLIANENEVFNDKQNTLTATAIEYCFQFKCHIAFVNVVHTEILAVGTRHEQTKIIATVRQSLYGTLPTNIIITRYTSHGESILTDQKQFLVAISEAPFFTPQLLLNGFVEVPMGQEAIAAELYFALIAQQQHDTL